MNVKLKSETIFIGVLLALGAAIAVVSWGYGFGTMQQPGPGLYPFFLGAAIVIFSLVLMMEAKPAPAIADRPAAWTLALMTLTFCLWIVAMPLLGYVLVTLAAAYAFCKIMKLEGWAKPLAVSAGTALFVYLLFDYWLYIDLPRGFLG